MLRIRSILHPTDFSPSAEAAFVQALHLARRFDAVLHLLHVAPVLDASHLHDAFAAVLDEDSYRDRVAAEAVAQREALLAAYDVRDVQLRWVLRHSLRTAAPILEYAAEKPVDLVVLGTHGRSGLRRLVLGSVAEELVRRLTCPTLAVRAPDDALERSARRFRRVVVPVDFSVHAYEALRHGRALADLDGAHLDLVHVIDPVQEPAFYRTGLARRGELERTLAEEARRHLHEAYGTPGEGVAFHILTGYPPEQIRDFAARTAADLIVMATHGLRGLERYPLGSVTERVVRAAPCPVLVTRPFGTSLLAAGVVEEAHAP